MRLGLVVFLTWCFALPIPAVPKKVLASQTVTGQITQIEAYLSLAETRKANGVLTLVGQVLTKCGEDWYLNHPIREFDELCSKLKAFGSPASRFLWVRNQIRVLNNSYQTFGFNQPRQAQPVGFLEESDYNSFSEIAVTSSADSGSGTLREAIEQANRVRGNRRITFRLPASDANLNRQTGVWRITLTNPIILQTNRVLIDGLSQAKFGGETNPNGPEIQIYDGIRRGFETLPGQDSSIFLASMICIYNGSQNWIRGFNFGSDEPIASRSWGGPEICNFSSDGKSFSNSNKITNNWLGVSPNGQSVESNLMTPGFMLNQGSSFNLVENNLIDNYGLQIWIVGTDQTNTVKGNIIRNNFFGTNSTGTKRLSFNDFLKGPFGYPATYITAEAGTGQNIIEKNTLAGTRGGAIGRIDNFAGTSVGDIIQQNRIGIGVNNENIAPDGNPENPLPPDQDAGAYSVGLFVGEGDAATNNIIANFPYCGIKVSDNSRDPNPQKITIIEENLCTGQNESNLF